MASPRACCALTALTLASALTGCKQPRAPTRSDTDPATQAVLGKIEGYRDCLEDHSTRVFEIADRYAERLGGGAPTPATDVLLVAAEDPEACLEAIAKAKELLPANPALDAAGQAFGTALRDVVALTNEGHGYFLRGSPTYDPGKGLALHARLVAAFAAFDHAQGELFDQVDALNRAAHATQLERRAAREGRSLVVLADQMIFEAEALVRHAAVPWDGLDRVDHARLTAAVHAFETALEELRSRALDDAAKTEQEYEGFPTIADRAQTYLVSAKQLVQRARGRVAYSDAERLMIAANNEAAVIGTPGAVIRAYNRLVASYWLK